MATLMRFWASLLITNGSGTSKALLTNVMINTNRPETLRKYLMHKAYIAQHTYNQPKEDAFSPVHLLADNQTFIYTIDNFCNNYSYNLIHLPGASEWSRCFHLERC